MTYLLTWGPHLRKCDSLTFVLTYLLTGSLTCLDVLRRHPLPPPLPPPLPLPLGGVKASFTHALPIAAACPRFWRLKGKAVRTTPLAALLGKRRLRRGGAGQKGGGRTHLATTPPAAYPASSTASTAAASNAVIEVATPAPTLPLPLTPTLTPPLPLPLVAWARCAPRLQAHSRLQAPSARRPASGAP